MNIDLKPVIQVISKPPFSKNISIIQLHDEIAPPELMDLVFQIATFVDDANKNTPFNKDIGPEEKVFRLVEFLRMLKYKEASNFETCLNDLLQLKREAILSCLSFLAKDIDLYKKRAYLALFLSVPDVPQEFLHDDTIGNLLKEIEAVQEEFKLSHKHLDGLKQSGPNAATVKREIQLMEEEKQQLLNKIARIQKRVQGIPKSDQWLQAAQNLRAEQQIQASLEERIRDQKLQIQQVERKHQSVSLSLSKIQNSMMNATPDNVFAKMEEENRMNRFLAQENFPKQVKELEEKVKGLQQILDNQNLNEDDLKKMEGEIVGLNEKNARLSEEKMKASNSGDANLALFRQQAAIIAAKKEGTLAKIAPLQEQIHQLQTKLKEKGPQQSDTPMLQGEDFKRYVSELRGQSTIFKRKKQELSAVDTEYGILQRTEEILKKKQRDLEQKIREAEENNGVVGFMDAQANLEKASELKSEKDQQKGQQLEEISQIIQKIMDTINEKKNLLAPVIQQLRSMRQEAQDLDLEYQSKKQQYDAVMFSLETESTKIEQDIKNFKQEYQSNLSKYHHLNQMIQQAEITQDKVMNEMKAYIGADDMIELVQKARGFKTYRDLYNRKIQELEYQSRDLRDVYRTVKQNHEPHMRQIEMFKGVKQLLLLKSSLNKQILSGKGRDEGVAVVTQDRLVLA